MHTSVPSSNFNLTAPAQATLVKLWAVVRYFPPSYHSPSFSVRNPSHTDKEIIFLKHTDLHHKVFPYYTTVFSIMSLYHCISVLNSQLVWGQRGTSELSTWICRKILECWIKEGIRKSWGGSGFVGFLPYRNCQDLESQKTHFRSLFYHLFSKPRNSST